MAQRKTGIGCDQVLLIEPSSEAHVDFNYRIFNADGSEVEHCGNGARCVVKYLIERKISNKLAIKLKTKTSTIIGIQLKNKTIQVNMGMPKFKPRQIPFIDDESVSHNYHTIVNGQLIKFGIVSMGNPHTVIQVLEHELQNLNKLEEIAKELQNSGLFPNGVNVNFYIIKSQNKIKMRTYERGCGFTEACGTGACAVVAYNILQNQLDYLQNIKVTMPGGSLFIHWDKINDIQMSGNAVIVFDGEIQI